MNKLIKVAVDAMGGDNSPRKIIDGIELHHKKSKNVLYRLFGDRNLIEPIVKKKLIDNNLIEIIHTEDKVKGDDTAFAAAKRGKNTSLWLAIESIKNKSSDIIISAGNTGALLVIAKLNLKMIENIDCNEKNFIDFAIMGSSLLKSLFPEEKANVALLNIGSEEMKGNEVIKETYKKLSKIVNEDFEFKGFIEGNQLMDGNVNVIVADGFTGNIALKTAEGTANFITSELKEAMKGSVLGKLGFLISINSLKKFKRKLDPRLYNGAILLGLDSPVIKSHGGTDYIGFANSLSMAEKIAKNNLIEKIKNSIT